jgi:hypothetical protein
MLLQAAVEQTLTPSARPLFPSLHARLRRHPALPRLLAPGPRPRPLRGDALPRPPSPSPPCSVAPARAHVRSVPPPPPPPPPRGCGRRRGASARVCGGACADSAACWRGPGRTHVTAARRGGAADAGTRARTCGRASSGEGMERGGEEKRGGGEGGAARVENHSRRGASKRRARVGRLEAAGRTCKWMGEFVNDQAALM